MFPVNSPDNRSANPVEAHTAVRHKEALLPHTEHCCKQDKKFLVLLILIVEVAWIFHIFDNIS